MLKQPNATLALITKPIDTKEVYNREELFHLIVYVKQSLVHATIDLGSQKNMILATLVSELGIETKFQLKPYPLGWI